MSPARTLIGGFYVQPTFWVLLRKPRVWAAISYQPLGQITKHWWERQLKNETIEWQSGARGTVYRKEICHHAFRGRGTKDTVRATSPHPGFSPRK